MRAFLILLFLTLTMAVSTKAFAYYDDDISIAEYCDDELARSYGPEYNDIFFDVAGEAELRTDFFGNEYWYLVNNDAVCYVTFKENGYLDKVEVFFAD